MKRAKDADRTVPSESGLAEFWSRVSGRFENAHTRSKDHLYFLVVTAPQRSNAHEWARFPNDADGVFRIATQLATVLLPAVTCVRALQLTALHGLPTLMVVGSTGPEDGWSEIRELSETAALRLEQSAKEDGGSLELDHPEFGWFCLLTSPEIHGVTRQLVDGKCVLETNGEKLSKLELAKLDPSQCASFTRLVPSLANASEMFARSMAKAFADPTNVRLPGVARNLPKTRRGFQRLAETTTRDQPIIAAIKEGKSYRRVARDCKVGKTTVGRVAKAYGLTGHAPETVPLDGTLQENLSIRGKPSERRSK